VGASLVIMLISQCTRIVQHGSKNSGKNTRLITGPNIFDNEENSEEKSLIELSTINNENVTIKIIPRENNYVDAGGAAVHPIKRNSNNNNEFNNAYEIYNEENENSALILNQNFASDSRKPDISNSDTAIFYSCSNRQCGSKCYSMHLLNSSYNCILFGIVFALIGVISFAGQRRDNYWILHSVWHVGALGSTYFLISGFRQSIFYTPRTM